MKLRWPKFLTVKRTILFALLITIIVFVLVYLLGGYKAQTATDDRMSFTTEGFVDIQEYIEKEIAANDKKFAAKLAELTIDNFATKIKEVEALCKTVMYYSDSHIRNLRYRWLYYLIQGDRTTKWHS